MRTFTKMVILSATLVPAIVQAGQQWNYPCQTITAVANYMPINSSMFLALSPGIPGCASNSVAGAVSFFVGSDGVSSTNIDGILATSLTAFVSGQRVSIYYDDTNASACLGVVVAPGGYAAQCP